MCELDGRVVGELIAERFNWDRVRIGHAASTEKRKPILELRDGGERSCFCREVVGDGSVVQV